MKRKGVFQRWFGDWTAFAAAGEPSGLAPRMREQRQRIFRGVFRRQTWGRGPSAKRRRPTDRLKFCMRGH